MYTLMFALFLAAIIPGAIIILNMTLNSRNTMYLNKSSPFECGFDPLSSSRSPFSIRFFLLAILFVVFDIEVVLLMPIPLTPTHTSIIFVATLFLLILLVGLLHEWREGSLAWS